MQCNYEIMYLRSKVLENFPFHDCSELKIAFLSLVIFGSLV